MSNGGPKKWSDSERHFLYLCFAEFGCTKHETHDLFGRVYGAQLQSAGRTRYPVQQIADQYDQRFNDKKPVKIWGRICQTPGGDPLLPNEPQLRDTLRDQIVHAAAQTGGGNWLVTNPRSGQTRQTDTAIILQPAPGTLAAAAIARAPAHIQAAVTPAGQAPGPAPPAVLPVAPALVVPPPTIAAAAPITTAPTVPPVAQPPDTVNENDQENIANAEDQHEVVEIPHVLQMVHFSSLKANETMLVFNPSLTGEIAMVSDDSEVYELGGYVLPITVDSNTPAELCAPGQTNVVLMVCQADCCSYCRLGITLEGLEEYVDEKCQKHMTGLPIVHRTHVKKVDGTWYFGYPQGAKVPKYLTDPPTKYRLRRVQFGMNLGEETKSIVVVCKEGGCPVCDEDGEGGAAVES